MSSIFSKKLINVHQFIKKIPDEPLYKNGIRYYRTDLVDTPMVIGIKGYILIPKNGYEKELDYILLHEQEHIKKHDILKKYFVYFLIMIYWWFFPVYKLKEQVDLIIEMNVDFRVTKDMNKEEFFDYAQSIISCMTQSSSQGIGFSIDEHNDMKYRMKYLMEGYQAKKTNPLILATLGFVVFLSSLVVFEPIPLNQFGVFDLLGSSDSYIIHFQDGTDRLFIDGNDLGNISNIDDDLLKGIEILEEVQ
ncbi:M56 family metallopeptidase [Floccifex sp.]|uniref:M56 family metallopeptidase n=1 Tax=Floccifex sp. TaxID=2815810 RepID=UPI003F000EC5